MPSRKAPLRMFRLPSGKPVARLGQGTWTIGDDRARHGEEVSALRLGLDLGLALIDTAELYGDGRSERVVGEAIAGRRAEAYLVSKVLPENASRRGTVAACKRSLRRLGTDYLDLYLLHWQGSVALEETLEAFTSLRQAGLIRDYGVSNFDLADVQAAIALREGAALATNQVLYNLAHRGIEWDLLPWSRERGLPIMAYTPLGNSGREQRAILGNRAVRSIAKRHDATPAQVALAWTLRHDGVVAIPKASREQHVRDNRRALELALSAEELRQLDQAFPPPRRKIDLEML